MEAIEVKKFEEFHPESIDHVFIDVVQQGEGTKENPYDWVYELEPINADMPNIKIRIEFTEADHPDVINVILNRKYLKAARLQDEIYADCLKNSYNDLNDLF